MLAAQVIRHHARLLLAQPPWLRRWRAALGLLAMVLVGPVLAVEVPSPPAVPLGTLFYSSAERSALVRARQGPPDTASAPVSNRMTVNGVVKRKSGNSTAWVNGQTVHEGQSLPPIKKTTISSGSANLDGQQVRVGETLELNTKARTDIVAPGAVTLRKPK